MLGNLKIRGRLFLGFGVILALIAVISVWAIVAGNRTAIAVSEANRTNLVVIGLKNAILNVRQGRVLTWEYIATGNDSALKGRESAFTQFENDYEDAESHMTSPVGRRLAEDFHDAVRDFIAKSKIMVDLKARNVAIGSPEFTAAIIAFNDAAKNYATTNERASKFYDDASEADSAAALDQIRSSEWVSAIVGAIAVVLGLTSAVLIARGIAGPIQEMTKAMSALASGDLRVAIPIGKSRDEVGDMAAAMTTFKENALQAEELRARQKVDQEQRERRAHVIEELTGKFDATISAVIGQVAAASDELDGTAQSMASTAEQTSRQATSVAAASEQASANVQTVATAAEELSASISEIARQVAEAARVSTAASEEAARTNATVAALAAAADRIGEVVKLINDIASQTNLLALNATIEAARAGDAGKGFAVVASEVKELANQTGRATNEIGGQIAAVQEEVRRAVEAIKGIGDTVEQVRQISSVIASAVEEQGAATDEIARNVQQAAQGTQHVSSNIGGVTEAATSTGMAAGHVLTAASGLARNSERLRNEVNNFLASVKAA